MARRDVILRVRVTSAELEAWRAKAQGAGLTLSDLVRQSMDRVHTWTAARADLVRERNREIARIGNNLNQLARWANTHKGGVEAVRVLARLGEIAEAAKMLRRTGPS